MSGIIGGIVAGIVIVFIRFAARNASASVEGASGTRIARYPVVARGFTWILALVPVGLWVALFKATADQVGIGIMVCLAMSTAALSLLLEFNLARATWSESRIVSHSPWRKERSINWEDVAEVRFSSAANWIVIRDQSSVRIRLPTLFGGLAELLQTLKSNAPQSLGPSIDEATWQWRKSVSTRKILGLPGSRA